MRNVPQLAGSRYAADECDPRQQQFASIVSLAEPMLRDGSGRPDDAHLDQRALINIGDLVALAERDFLRLHTAIRPRSFPLFNLLSAWREKPAFSVRIWSAPCLVPPEGVRQTVSRRARLIPSGGSEPSRDVAVRATSKRRTDLVSRSSGDCELGACP